MREPEQLIRLAKIEPDGASTKVEFELLDEAHTVAHPVPWTQVCLTRRA